eukprot:1804889-Amphidinium_carterae.1
MKGKASFTRTDNSVQERELDMFYASLVPFTAWVRDADSWLASCHVSLISAQGTHTHTNTNTHEHSRKHTHTHTDTHAHARARSCTLHVHTSTGVRH